MYCPVCRTGKGVWDRFCGKCGFRYTGTQIPRVSKGFYLGSILGGMGVSTLLEIIALISLHSAERAATWFEAGRHFETYETLSTFSLLPMLYGAIVHLVLVYYMWAAIQDGYARTTPGKAVGYLFIPFYNLYWMFQVWWGFAQDYNRLIKRHGLNMRRLPEGLFLAYSVLTLLSSAVVVTSMSAELPLIEFATIGLLVGITGFTILVFMAIEICNGINVLSDCSAGALPGPAAFSPAAPGQQPVPPLAAPYATHKRAVPVLKGVSGQHAGKSIELSAVTLVIGRDSMQSQLVYPQYDESISRKHCSIYFDQSSRKFILEDFSSNGTYLWPRERLIPGRQYHLEAGARFFLANPGETFELSIE